MVTGSTPTTTVGIGRPTTLWGDVAFHYGRWVDDPEDGWLWIPGYTWSPGWVVWRSNGQYVGWMPAPPDRGVSGRQGDKSVRPFRGRGFGYQSASAMMPPMGYRSWYVGPVSTTAALADTIGSSSAPATWQTGTTDRVVVRDPRQVMNILSASIVAQHHALHGW